MPNKSSNRLSLTLSKKITLGFTLVLIILSGLSYFSWSAITNASAGFKDYRGMAKDSLLMSELESDMLMVRMNVKDYIITGSDKDFKQYKEYYESMYHHLQNAEKEIQDPKRAKLVKEIDTDITKYNEAFLQVVEKRSQRNKIVNESLNVNGPLLERKLSQIMTSAKKDEDVEAGYNTGVTLKHLLLGRLYMAKYLDSNSKAAADRVYQEFDKVSDSLKHLKEIIENEERRKILAQVITLKEEYRNSFKELQNIITTRNDIIANTLDKIGPVIAGLAKDVKLSIKGVQDEIGPRVDKEGETATTEIITLATIALITGIALSFILTRVITKPLKIMATTLRDIAEGEGDLTQRLDEARKDEIGECSKWFNVFIQKLQGIIKEITTNADNLTGSSGALSETSSQMAQSVDQMNAQTATTAAAAEEMTINMSNMSASSEQMTTNLKNVASTIQGLNESINEVSSSANQTSSVATQAETLVNESNKKITGLSVAADEIGKVVTVIQDIAEQTNLLALNATIEAARAGEAGKGFSVVASEVKALARQTGEATLNISQLISGIQGSAKESVKAIEEINAVIIEVSKLSNNIAQSVDQQSTSTQEIAGNINEVAQASESVSVGVSESAKATQEITHTITQVSGIANQTSQGATDTQTASKGVSDSAADLKNLVGQFKV